MSKVSNTLANGVRRWQVTIHRYIQSLNGDVQQRIVGVRADLVKIVAAGDPTEPARFGDKLNRIDAITVDAKKLAASEYRKINGHTSDQITDLADHDQSITAQLIERTAGDLAITTVPARKLGSIVSRALVDGAPSAEWWSRQAADVAKRFHDQVRQGVQAGESIGKLITRVRGTGPNYLDGVMGVGQRNAEALVRSSVLSAQHDARMGQFRQNGDVIQGWAILTTFDDRTCEICMALSGAAFDLNGDPLPGSSFQHRLPSGGLPIHWSCRCVASPILIGEGIPEDFSFENWLGQQPVAEQKDILGEQWYAAWKSGELRSLRDRIDQRGRPITLKELRGEQKAAA